VPIGLQFQEKSVVYKFIARKHYCCKSPELIYVHSGVDKESSLLGKGILINRKASFRRL